jgi:hypothetical protein
MEIERSDTQRFFIHRFSFVQSTLPHVQSREIIEQHKKSCSNRYLGQSLLQPCTESKENKHHRTILALAI